MFGLIISSSSVVRKRSQSAQRQADLRNIQTALQQYYSDQNFFPSDSANNPLITTTSSPTQVLTNSVGRLPLGTIPLKTYLPKIPSDPVTGTATPYCYRAFADSSMSGGACTNSASNQECHYFVLCANLNNGTGLTQCSSCPGSGNNYDFVITP